MQILVIISFIFSVAFMLGLDVVLWIENPLYGIGGIVGVIAYFIAYSISGDMIIAPRDFWKLSSWQIFKKKIGYAFSTYLIVTLVAAGILGAVYMR